MSENVRHFVLASTDQEQFQKRSEEREREIENKFIGLFEDRVHRGPYSPYKPCNHNLYIGIIIFPHIGKVPLGNIWSKTVVGCCVGKRL